MPPLLRALDLIHRRHFFFLQTEDRLQSVKRKRTSQEQKQASPKDATQDATDLLHELTEAPEVHNSTSRGEPQETIVAVLLEGVPMQSRRRLSVSPEADEAI